MDIGFVAINLRAEQMDWLGQKGIHVFTRLSALPRFNDAPDHAYALTCRPYLPAILPGYDGYIWVDSDIRFLLPGGLQHYAGRLADPGVAIVAAQETEAAYSVNADPQRAQSYHEGRVRRLTKVYDAETVRYCQYFTPFNAGLFAARGDSPIWVRYRRNLDKALRAPFDGLLGQDALNISLVEVGRWVRVPAILNWLCSWCMPVKAPDGTWRHPGEQNRQVFVAHLTDLAVTVEQSGRRTTFYELYRSVGLAE